MSYLLPIISFAFVMSITPGPNNIMLWASGANYGLRRTLPHLFGVNLGFGSLILLCGLGLGVIFETFPLFQTVLKVIGSLYLLYLALRIATASSAGAAITSRPQSFWEAVGFQYANPKAWVIGLTAMSTFSIPQSPPLLNAMLITLTMMVINLPCIAVWVVFGTAIGRFLTNPTARLVCNLVMAGLLVGTIVWMV